MLQSQRRKLLILILLFLIAFVMRAYQPLSRSPVWLPRAEAFIDAIETQDWISTYQRHHPGVTVMLFGGVGMHLYEQVQDTPASFLFDWAMPAYITEYGEQMIAGVVGLAFVLAALVIVIVLILDRLTDWPTALAAGVLITFSPIVLASSRNFNLDASLSSFMLVSALLLLLYMRERRWLHLVLSGVSGGLALLSKSPALFLVPYTGLVLLAYLAADIHRGWGTHPDRRWRWVSSRLLLNAVLPGLLWVLAAFAVYWLWPAMWKDPVGILAEMYYFVRFHTENAHPNPHFFMGRILLPNEHPGFLHYPAMLIINSTAVTLILLLIALAGYIALRKKMTRSMPPLTFWLLIAYIVFYTIQMSIGAKQIERYILPSHMAMEVLAAVGLIGLADLVRRALENHRRKAAQYSICLVFGLAFVFQAVVALSFHPSYGAHHNYLFGGNRGAINMISVMGYDEGLMEVGLYLAEPPDAETLTLSSLEGANLPTVSQFFPGGVSEALEGEDIDYYLFIQRLSQRQLYEQDWLDKWQALQTHDPVLRVVYDGVDYAWLYAANPGSAETVVYRGGWIGFTALAWLWAVAAAAGLIWALRATPEIPSGAEEPVMDAADRLWGWIKKLPGSTAGRAFLLLLSLEILLVLLQGILTPGTIIGRWLDGVGRLILGAVFSSAVFAGLAIAGWVLHRRKTAERRGLLLLALTGLLMGAWAALNMVLLLPVGLQAVIGAAILAAGLAGAYLIWYGQEHRVFWLFAGGLLMGAAAELIMQVYAAGAVCHDPLTVGSCQNTLFGFTLLQMLGANMALAAALLVGESAGDEPGRQPVSRLALAGGVVWSALLTGGLWFGPAIDLQMRGNPAEVAYQGGDLSLLAYHLDEQRLIPGQTTTVTLYWRANAPMPFTDYRLSAHWLAQPEYTSVAQADYVVIGQVGRFNYPGYAWLPGRVVRQTLQIRLPDDLPAPQSYALMLRAWHDILENSDLQTDLVMIGPEEVLLAEAPALPETIEQPPAIDQIYHFGERFTLQGYALPAQAQAGDTIDITFWWQSAGQSEMPLNQFVHLYSTDGAFVTGYDQPPFGGRFPTTDWLAGAAFKDIWQVPLPADLAPGDYLVYTGLYEWPSLLRWAVTDEAGQPVQDNTALLGTIHVTP